MLCRQAKVVLSTVGPFEKYGSGLVEACVKEGAHYCDITGEVSFHIPRSYRTTRTNIAASPHRQPASLHSTPGLRRQSHWVAEMMRKFGAEAKAKKVRLVPMRWDAAKGRAEHGPQCASTAAATHSSFSCSGFDSIPSDLGALMMTNAMKARHNVACSRIDVFVTNLRGGASGGV